jgi:hypothetical protein
VYTWPLASQDELRVLHHTVNGRSAPSTATRPQRRRARQPLAWPPHPRASRRGHRALEACAREGHRLREMTRLSSHGGPRDLRAQSLLDRPRLEHLGLRVTIQLV